MSDVMEFDSGLSDQQDDEIDNLRIEIFRLKERVEALGRHRSCSTAITKLDEAGHWLWDRAHRAA